MTHANPDESLSTPAPAPDAAHGTPPGPAATAPTESSPAPGAPATPPVRPSAAAAPPAVSGGMDARLEAEIDAALGGMSVSDLLDAPRAAPRAVGRATIHREFRTGTIVRIRNDEVLVEFGPKSSGICPLAQFDEPPPIGTRLEFVVERVDPTEGMLVLSREGAVQKASWEALSVGQVVEATCVGMNKGGLEFEVAHHKAFMPAGQVDIRRVEDISIFLGQKLACQITQLDRNRGRLVLSRRAFLEKERKRLGEQILAELAQGQDRDATITSVMSYGAFADLGGIDGLIHVSDLAWERVHHPQDVVQPGQSVRVRVLKVDRDQDPPKISLGMKQTSPDPAKLALGALEPGATVDGTVTRLMPFGAFVQISGGVEGLVHISEISHERVDAVERVLKVGQSVSAKVLTVDPKRKRVALSIKAILDRPAMAGGRGRPGDAEGMRDDDPAMRKLRAKLQAGLGGGDLKGGIA